MNKIAMVWMLVLTVVAGSAAAQTSKEPPELEALRASLKKYEDPYVAVHDGYFSTVGCMVLKGGAGAGQLAYKAGGMGVHFLNPAAISPKPDPGRPTVLLYEPVNGKLKLTGAEWFVPLAASKERPELWGQKFDGPMMGHPPLLPAELTHWDLHVWLYKKNPLGVFAPTNPDVTCADTPYRLVEEAPMLAENKP